MDKTTLLELAARLLKARPGEHREMTEAARYNWEHYPDTMQRLQALSEQAGE